MNGDPIGRTDLVPVPGLEFVYETTVDVTAAVPVGQTTDGFRRIIPVRGEGRLQGPHIRGHLLAEAADWQVTRSDGVTVVDAMYAIRTDDGVVIQVRNRGLRRGPSDVLERIVQGENVDPAEYYFRTVPEFIAPAGKYEWLNQNIFICAGARYADGVRLQAWRIT
ncbi:DUF3237 domain-containing protein [Arthrobacter sp. CDRTa11]|uniref:DUF3237 domain-containing protein n=1 Tax=Arthrobacter sp. CDRTa11 TaxID=2651199 RepID=UPI002265D07D|nr:DUF3237 domain-containing protein [Arthrobacter sp. CDRTa11]UZX02872.1 DUF3237 domain-containing protein [Arthrobacter sp. CDRTa11]